MLTSFFPERDILRRIEMGGSDIRQKRSLIILMVIESAVRYFCLDKLYQTLPQFWIYDPKHLATVLPAVKLEIFLILLIKSQLLEP